MKKLDVSLVESEAKLLLEAISELEAKWLEVCESSSDEDEIADYGNDLIELRLLKEKLVTSAKAEFGSGVVNFNRAPL